MTKPFYVFDWNGTLFDDIQVAVDGFNTVLRHYGHDTVTVDQFCQCYDTPFSQFFRNCGIDEREAKRIGEEGKPIFHDYYEPHTDSCGLRQGAADLLRQLKQDGALCFILSNHVKPAIERHLRRLGIADCFDAVLAFADKQSQFKEPKGEMLRCYLAEHGLHAGGTIVGDSAEETRIGKEQHLATIAVAGGYSAEDRLQKAQPDRLIHALAELMPRKAAA